MTGIRLATAANNGTTTPVFQARHGHLHESHLRTLFVFGDFGGANVAFQISPQDPPVDWFDVTNADLITADKTVNVEFRAPNVRLNITGGTGEAIDAILL